MAKELDEANREKAQAEKIQEELKMKYISTKVNNDEESKRHVEEQNELNQLRKTKRQLVKERDIAEKDCESLSNELS